VDSPYLWIRLPGGLDSWPGFDLLLNEYQVVVTPGVGFGACGEGYIRTTSFGNPEDTAVARSASRRLCGDRETSYSANRGCSDGAASVFNSVRERSTFSLSCQKKWQKETRQRRRVSFGILSPFLPAG
jgi:aspartate/methionine/tyrosine aminotransferase